MRALQLLLLFAVAATAGALEDAEADVRSKDAKQIKRGLEALVQRNDRACVDVLVRMLRKTAKEYDRERAAFDSQTEEGFEKMAEALAIMEGLATRAKSTAEFNKAVAASSRLVSESVELVTKAIERNVPFSIRHDRGRAALDKLNSDDAVARIVQVATRERPGRLRHWLLVSLGRRKSAAVGSMLLPLCTDRDPRTRAVAVWGLGHHGQVAGVAEALVQALDDEFWQVRHGACAGLVAAKKPDPLVAAQEGATGRDQLLLARALHQLEKAPAPPEPPAIAFGFPVISRRVRIVVDLSASMKEHLPMLRTEVEKAVRALPEGATLQLVTVGAKVETLGKKAWKIRKDAWKRAVAWFDARVPGGKASYVRIRRSVVPPYDHPSKGKRVFGTLPDTVYLILGPSKEANDHMVLSEFARWNDACHAQLYVRILRADPNPALVKAVNTLKGVLLAGEAK